MSHEYVFLTLVNVYTCRYGHVLSVETWGNVLEGQRTEFSGFYEDGHETW